MRILIINSEYPPIGGGAGNASAHLARKLAALNQDVAVLTAHFKGLPRDTLEHGIRVRRIKSMRRNRDRSGAVEQGVFLLQGSLSVLSLIREWRPDIILAFFGVPCGAVAWFAKGITGIPYLVSLRGGDVPGFRPYDFAIYHRVMGPILHWVWRRAGAVVANSKGLAQLAKEFDHQVEIDIIPNGVDVSELQQPEKREWDPPRMVFAGRLVYQKGLDILVKALGGLTSFPWELKLVGDGPHRPVLESLLSDLGISDRIEFLGWLDREAVAHQYREANLFVFPSRHEGMPNAVLEAMACGLPVIATNIAGNDELVHPEVTGLLVPPEDHLALRNALEIMLLAPLRRKEMGAEARKLVKELYTWDQVADQYLSLIRKILGKR
jgi:glycosyltransferase involved in cell wall biosynthesis